MHSSAVPRLEVETSLNIDGGIPFPPAEPDGEATIFVNRVTDYIYLRRSERARMRSTHFIQVVQATRDLLDSRDVRVRR